MKKLLWLGIHLRILVLEKIQIHFEINFDKRALHPKL